MTNDNTEQDDEGQMPADVMRQIAAQLETVQMAQQVTRETFIAMFTDEIHTTQSNALAEHALAILAPEGGMRMVTMCATAAVVASIVQGIIQTDLQEDGKAMPSDVLIMAINMMAQHLIRSNQMHTDALNAAVTADPNRAN